MISLEPEAAVIYCRQLKMYQLMPESNNNQSQNLSYHYQPYKPQDNNNNNSVITSQYTPGKK